MDYLIAQTSVFLLLAALLGGGVGWLLRGRTVAADRGAPDRGDREAEESGPPPA